MRVELYREADPEHLVASASWDGRRVRIEASDDELRAAVERIFRPVPVVVDDPALLPQGARGQVVLLPGSLAWFRAAAFARAGAAGLEVRVVPQVVGQGGWDPAASYRTFDEQVERVVASSYPAHRLPQPGERPSPARDEVLATPPVSDPPARN